MSIIIIGVGDADFEGKDLYYCKTLLICKDFFRI